MSWTTPSSRLPTLHQSPHGEYTVGDSASLGFLRKGPCSFLLPPQSRGRAASVFSIAGTFFGRVTRVFRSFHAIPMPIAVAVAMTVGRARPAGLLSLRRGELRRTSDRGGGGSPLVLCKRVVLVLRPSDLRAGTGTAHELRICRHELSRAGLSGQLFHAFLPLRQSQPGFASPSPYLRVTPRSRLRR
jgi:hypothetical protein